MESPPSRAPGIQNTFKRRRRRCPSKFRSAPLHTPSQVLFIVVGLMYYLLNPVHSVYDFCQSAAASADGGDLFLSPEQFAYMVLNVTDGTLDFFTDPSSVPSQVTQSYALRADASKGLDMSNSSTVVAMCSDLYDAILNYYGVTFDLQECKDSVSFAEGNNPRITTDEFVRFVWSISQGEFGTDEKGPDPNTLPTPLYLIYEAYGILDFENVDDDYYIGACSETMVAVKVASHATGVPVEETISPTSGGEGTSAPTSQNSTMSDSFFETCKIALVIGDSIARDDQLSADEYVRFLSRLLPNDIAFSDSFDNLPTIFQASFQSLSGDQGYIDVSGSKPNLEPTDSQLANLQNLCSSTENTITEYQSGVGSTPAPSPSNNVQGDDDEALTAQDFVACRISLMYSDLNRDDELDTDEYVKFINRLLNATSSTFSSSTDLSPIFQASFANLSSGVGYIDVSGSKPSPLPSDAQLAHLETVCKESDKALSQFVNGDNVEQSNSTIAPTQDEFFTECTSALAVADRDYDGFMSQDEYVRFVSKLVGTTYTSFSSLNSEMQSNYDTISNGSSSGVDIAGSSGSPTASQLDQLEFVCSETEAILHSNGGDNANITNEEFDQCVNAISISDRNSDGWLEPIEYIDLLNLLLSNKFQGLSFSTIDELFRVNYEKSKGPNEFIGIGGAKSISVATEEQIANLKAVCGELIIQITYYERTKEDQLSSCLSVVQSQVTEESDSLTLEEYLTLINELSDHEWANTTSLDALPFVLRDNFEWIRWDGNSVELSKLTGATSNLTERLQWSCQRTIVALDLALDVLAEASGSPLQFCTIPLSFTDLNADNSLNEQEFHLFINHLSGNAWADLDFDEIDPSFHDLFSSYVDSSNQLIPIHGSKPNDSPTDAEVDYLNTFCAKAEDAVSIATENAIFFNSCVTALGQSDMNIDGMLTYDEFANVLCLLSGWDTKTTSKYLSSALQGLYDSLKTKRSDSGVDVGGSASGLNRTSTQERHLKQICNITKESIWSVQPPTEPPFTGGEQDTRVANAFVVSNVKGLAAKDLVDGLNRVGLNEAYLVFVEELVSRSKPSLIRGRRLQSASLLTNSAEIYRMDDYKCPQGVQEGSNCLIAYGSFYLERPPAQTIQNLSQKAIDAGELQVILSRVDSRNDLHILGAYPPADGTVNDNEPSSTSNESSIPFGVMIGIAVAASCAIFALVLFLYCYCNKEARVDCCGRKQMHKEANHKAAPECSPYALDHDQAAYFGAIPQYGRKPSDHEFGDESISEHFEDEPDYRARNSPRSAKKRSNEPTGPERFDDEPVYTDHALSAKDPRMECNVTIDQFDDLGTHGNSKTQIESHRAPVYADNSYGALQGEEQHPEHAVDEDDAYVTFTPSAGPAGDNSEIDEVGHEYFASKEVDPQVEGFTGSESDKNWNMSPLQWDTGDEGPPDVDSTSGTSRGNEGSSNLPSSPGEASRSNESQSYQGSRENMVSPRRPTDADTDAEFDVFRSPVQQNRDRDDEDDGYESTEEEEEEGDESDDEDGTEESDGTDDSGSGSDSDDARESEAETIDDSILNTSSSQPYYQEIKALVAQVVPDELENIDAMMEQFAGKEDELLHTLQNMAGISHSESGESEDEDEESGDSASESEATEDEADESGDEESEDDEAFGDDNEPSDEVSDDGSDYAESNVAGDESASSFSGREEEDEEEEEEDENERSESEDDEQSEEGVQEQSDEDADEDDEEEGGGEGEESYYSEEEVESSVAVESEQSDSENASSYEEESYHSEEDEEETIDDEEETIDEDADDESSSYCSDSE